MLRDLIKADIDVIPGESLLSNCINNLHNSHDNIMSMMYCQSEAIINRMVMEKMKIEQMVSSLLTNYSNFVHPAHVNLMLFTRREVK